MSNAATWLSPEFRFRPLLESTPILLTRASNPLRHRTSFSAARSPSVHTDTVSCVPKHFMQVDWIRERMVAIDVEEAIPAVSAGVLTRRDALNTVACDYLIHCFVEAVRRHDRAKRL